MKTILVSLLALFMFFGVNAQSINLTITDNASNEVMPFASVTVFNDSNIFVKGVLSNLLGEAKISLEEGNYNIRVSYVGYEDHIIESTSVKLNTAYHYDAKLKQGLKLQEIVIEEYSIVSCGKQLDACTAIIHHSSCNGSCTFRCGLTREFITVSVVETEQEEVDELKEPTINIYPNPTVDNINVSFENGIVPKGNIRLIDAAGKVLLDRELTSNEKYSFEMSSYNKGAYFLQYVYENKIVSKKIIKQ